MNLAILGAGPHGRQLARLLSDHTVSLFDDDPSVSALPLESARGRQYVIGAAWPTVRKSIWHRANALLMQAFCDGNVIFPGARIGNDVEVGQHVHVNFNAVISHGCRIGSFVTVCPNAALAGDVTVGDGAFIGIGASVVHGGITIGAGATVGAGAVVTRDVPPSVTVAGVPARILGAAA